MLAQASSGGTAALNALIASAVSSNSRLDPWVQAGVVGVFSGVLCADFGPQRDNAALSTASAAVAAREPRFAWRSWDADSDARGAAGDGHCVS